VVWYLKDGQVNPEPFFFFFTLVAGPRRSLSLKLSDTRVYEPQIPLDGPSAREDGDILYVVVWYLKDGQVRPEP